jgi:hypothetical protein
MPCSGGGSRLGQRPTGGGDRPAVLIPAAPSENGPGRLLLLATHAEILDECSFSSGFAALLLGEPMPAFRPIGLEDCDKPAVSDLRSQISNLRSQISQPFGGSTQVNVDFIASSRQRRQRRQATGDRSDRSHNENCHNTMSIKELSQFRSVAKNRSATVTRQIRHPKRRFRTGRLSDQSSPALGRSYRIIFSTKKSQSAPQGP